MSYLPLISHRLFVAALKSQRGLRPRRHRIRTVQDTPASGPEPSPARPLAGPAAPLESPSLPAPALGS
jgi:hypothetical protein